MIRSERSIATGSQAADPRVERVVEPVEQQQQHGDHRDDRPHQHALHDRALAAVGEEQHVHEDHARDEEEHDPELGRDHPDRAVDAVEPRFLPRRCLIEPLVVGGLLDGRLRLHRLAGCGTSARPTG